MIPNVALAGKLGTFFGTSFGTERFFSAPNVEAALFFLDSEHDFGAHGDNFV
jgi:hypothetical protein